MWELLQEARIVYQQEVIRNGKLHHRFVSDFISYHAPVAVTDEQEWRIHIQNINAVYEFLMDRLDLVNEYFNKDHFTLEDCEAMLHTFNTHDQRIPSAKDESSLLGHFTEPQIELITAFVNEQEMFKQTISSSEIRNLFRGELELPLPVNHNGRVAMFLSCLRDELFLVYPWQKVLEYNKLLSSCSTGRPLTREQIKNSLSAFRKTHLYPYTPFVNFVRQLKEKIEKEE